MANKAFTTSTKKGTMKCAQENPKSLMIQVSLSNTSKRSEYGKADLNIQGLEYRGIIPKITLGKRKASLCRAHPFVFIGKQLTFTPWASKHGGLNSYFLRGSRKVLFRLENNCKHNDILATNCHRL